MTKPHLIGLCGRSGAGKGYVAEIFRRFGVPGVDTDALYRTMTAPSDTVSPCMQALCAAFGEEIMRPDHSLNREKMRSLVFAPDGETARQRLNRITHAHILRETLYAVEEHAKEDAPLVLIDAPLLFESGFDRLCRFTVAVTASHETSVARIMKRDGISREKAEQRLSAQIPESELVARCDYRILNEMSSGTVRVQVAAVLRDIRQTVGLP